MRGVWDGFLSVMSGLLALAICGIPAFYTFRAIRAEIAPTWVYVPMGLLAAVGLILAYAFVTKGFKGVSPSRSRKRRS